MIVDNKKSMYKKNATKKKIVLRETKCKKYDTVNDKMYKKSTKTFKTR